MAEPHTPDERYDRTKAWPHPLEVIPVGGWMATENRLELDRLLREHDVHTVTEVGSFLGLSAIWFAARVDKVTCVDLWVELASHISNNNLVGTFYRWELPRDFFPIFRDNIMRSGHWAKVHPLRGNSHYIHGEVEHADLVYLDGDHSYGACKRDIEIYREKAGKVLCGDDHVEREGFGVIQAVKEMLPGYQHNGPFWWWVRPTA